MKVIELDMYQATAVAAIVLLLGRILVDKIAVLRRYCIPAPVVGGFIYAILHLAVRSAGIVEISADMTLKNVFMVAFFCSVGYTASFRMLKKGGIQTIVFLLLAVVMVVLQNCLGAGLASAFGLDPRLGLATGSIPMVGGHGTAGSFGPMLEELGVANANVVAIASATFGLVAGCAIGGPIAYNKIHKYKLISAASDTTVEEIVEKDETGAIDSKRFLDAFLYLIIAIGVGTVVSMFLGKLMTFPFYIGAMLVGAVIRNIMDVQQKEIPMEEIGTLGGSCLSIFLGLAMIDMKLWQLAELALPLVVMLAAQTILMFLYAYFVVFNVLGRTYDAAVMTTGFCGFGMGATPNAMANMQAVTGQYGPAPTAFMVVPLVGSLFIDFLNASILTAFINFFH
ncbi:sodium/glutamate symporter [Clostridium transplantifaecale]|uniref:sodium/glutamate symporter n=1 Tax=Clostridium transplantifaecale TaxID=2479838 RepID=UPI000F640425|nr:sodium/glutamate symporter [Clostridium transplantifaecale]